MFGPMDDFGFRDGVLSAMVRRKVRQLAGGGELSLSSDDDGSGDEAEGLRLLSPKKKKNKGFHRGGKTSIFTLEGGPGRLMVHSESIQPGGLRHAHTQGGVSMKLAVVDKALKEHHRRIKALVGFASSELLKTSNKEHLATFGMAACVGRSYFKLHGNLSSAYCASVRIVFERYRTLSEKEDLVPMSWQYIWQALDWLGEQNVGFELTEAEKRAVNQARLGCECDAQTFKRNKVTPDQGRYKFVQAVFSAPSADEKTKCVGYVRDAVVDMVNNTHKGAFLLPSKDMKLKIAPARSDAAINFLCKVVDIFTDYGESDWPEDHADMGYIVMKKINNWLEYYEKRTDGFEKVSDYGSDTDHIFDLASRSVVCEIKLKKANKPIDVHTKLLKSPILKKLETICKQQNKEGVQESAYDRFHVTILAASFINQYLLLRAMGRQQQDNEDKEAQFMSKKESEESFEKVASAGLSSGSKSGGNGKEKPSGDETDDDLGFGGLGQEEDDDDDDEKA